MTRFIFVEEGEFKDNKLQGFGRRMNSNGYCTTGYMNEGLLHGYATIIKPDSTIDEGLWENGCFKSIDGIDIT